MTLSKDRVMPELVAMLREGRDFYLYAQQETLDSELAAVFGFAAQTRQRLLDSLVEAKVLLHTSPEHIVPPLPADIGHSRLTKQFDRHHPEVLAHALLDREQRLLSVLGFVFQTETSLAVKRAIKDQYAMFTRGAEMLKRFARRYEAA